MKYNIEKINQIGKKEALIGDVEMAIRENLLEIGRSALKYFSRKGIGAMLENADEDAEMEIECACGGKLKYQRRREATIWSESAHTFTFSLYAAKSNQNIS